MKINQLILLFFSITILSSCGGNLNSDKSEDLSDKADSLLKVVMNEHDEVMPNTLKLENIKKKIIARMDSVELDSASQARIDVLISRMDTAILGMRDWMNGFERPADSLTAKQVVDYYLLELKKIKNVSDQTFKIMPEAEDELNKKDSL